MRKKVSKMVALILTFILTVFFQTTVAQAKEYDVTDNSTVDDIEINLLDDIELTVESDSIDEETSVKNNIGKIEEFKAEGIQLMATQVETETEPESLSEIYYGSELGYLSNTNDYLLYPANLPAGSYLQAKLTLPNNSQIDYDLLLFDSALSLIKTCDYITCTSDSGTLDESIGYLADADEKVYVCVYSVAGGSATEAYTLNYSVTTNFADSTEPDENAKEATALTLSAAGVDVERKLNSPIDNDWYSFDVLDGPDYDKIRLSVTSSSAKNGCIVEIYQNLVSDYYGMYRIGSGTGGEIALPAGTYFLRVVSTNTFENFDEEDIPTYHLSVKPVSRVDEIVISNYSSYYGNENVDYPQGRLYRVDQKFSNVVTIRGRAYYRDENGVREPAANANILGKVVDKQWEAISRPDMSTVESSAITDSNGYYEITFYLKTALGGLSHHVLISTHYYDLMEVTIQSANDSSVKATGYFYYLKYSDND